MNTQPLNVSWPVVVQLFGPVTRGVRADLNAHMLVERLNLPSGDAVLGWSTVAAKFPVTRRRR